MILGVIEELGLAAECCAMVGDRIYTDMAMAEASGVHGILVLSGEATAEDASSSGVRMSLVAPSVDSLCR
jgi:ribonucleotide monophosphatase NagD (HAD superfamily)